MSRPRRQCEVIVNGERCPRPHRALGCCTHHYWNLTHHGDPLVSLKASPGEPFQYFLLNVEWFSGPYDPELDVWPEGKLDPSWCKLWPYARTPAGYGRFKWDVLFQVHVTARRYMDGLLELPDRAPGHNEVRHLCGNADLGCWSWDHLRWGTRQENAQDAVRHGTMRRGSTVGTAKLTEDDVSLMRQLHGTTTNRALADRFGVSPTLVGMIVRREVWKHVV